MSLLEQMKSWAATSRARKDDEENKSQKMMQQQKDATDAAAASKRVAPPKSQPTSKEAEKARKEAAEKPTSKEAEKARKEADAAAKKANAAAKKAKAAAIRFAKGRATKKDHKEAAEKQAAERRAAEQRAAEKPESKKKGKRKANTAETPSAKAAKPEHEAAAEESNDRTTTAPTTRKRPFSESCALYRASRAQKKEVLPTDCAGSEDNVDATPAKSQRKDGLDASTPDKVDGARTKSGKGTGHTKQEMIPAPLPAAPEVTAAPAKEMTPAPLPAADQGKGKGKEKGTLPATPATFPATPASLPAIPVTIPPTPVTIPPTPDATAAPATLQAETASLQQSATLPGESSPGVQEGARGRLMDATMSTNEKNAKWAKFIRTLMPSAERSEKTEKACPELAQKMVSLADKKHWYYIWLEEGCKWSKVMATESFRRTVREVDSVVVDWMTLNQLEDWYKDPELAKSHKEVMERKPVYVGWKPHPDQPTIAKATQYAITISSAKKKEIERLKAQQVTWQGELDPEGAARLSSMLAGDLSASPQSSSSTLGVSAVPVEGVPALPAQAAPQTSSPDDAFAREVQAAKAAAAERQRLKEEKDRAKQEKQRAEKDAKEKAKVDFANSNAGKAKKAGDELGKELEKNQKAQGDVVTCTMNKAMKSEWAACFAKHARELKKHLKHLQQVEATNADDGEERVIEPARRIAELFKRDLKGFQALVRAQARAPV